MLKYLYKANCLDINKLLLMNYTKIGVTDSELPVVLHLFDLASNNAPTLVGLSKKTSLSSDECGRILNGLVNRGLVTLKIEWSKAGKAKETFCLDEIINELEKIVVQQQKMQEISENESIVKQIVNLLETSFQRNLSPNELTIVMEWIDEPITAIKEAIDKAIEHKKKTIRYIDQLLNSKHNASDTEIDKKKVAQLDELFKNYR